MSERITESYLQKAVESLIGAESEYTNGRYNNCANRSSYACVRLGTERLNAVTDG